MDFWYAHPPLEVQNKYTTKKTAKKRSESEWTNSSGNYLLLLLFVLPSAELHYQSHVGMRVSLEQPQHVHVFAGFSAEAGLTAVRHWRDTTEPHVTSCKIRGGQYGAVGDLPPSLSFSFWPSQHNYFNLIYCRPLKWAGASIRQHSLTSSAFKDGGLIFEVAIC